MELKGTRMVEDGRTARQIFDELMANPARRKFGFGARLAIVNVDFQQAYTRIDRFDMAHKRIELAVRAFTRLRLPLVVVGNGPDARRLQRLAGPTVQFTGRVGDARVAELLRSARALVVTATEEFGIAAVEAQASGRPVIAVRDGGVLETVIDGETGVFFDRPEVDDLVAAVQAFDPLAIDPVACVDNARRFDVTRFRRGFRSIAEQALAGEHRAARPARVRRARGLALPR